MKKPGYTALIELAVALLVFALASTVILQPFMQAYDTGRDAQASSQALVYAQDCAQRLAAGEGNAAGAGLRGGGRRVFAAYAGWLSHPRTDQRSVRRSRTAHAGADCRRAGRRNARAAARGKIHGKHVI